MKAQTGECRYRCTFFNLGSRCGVGVQRHTPATLSPERDTVPILLEACLATEPVWKGAENLVSPGIRSADGSARSV
jgi:hypothetical protein